MHFYLGSMEQSVYDTFVLLGGVLSLVYLFLHIKHKKQFPGVVSNHIINYTKNKNARIPIESITAIIEIFIIFISKYKIYNAATIKPKVYI